MHVAVLTALGGIHLDPEEEVALRNNREAFERIKLLPRMLVDVSGRNLATSIFGIAMLLGLIIIGTASGARRNRAEDSAILLLAGGADHHRGDGRAVARREEHHVRTLDPIRSGNRRTRSGTGVEQPPEDLVVAAGAGR